MNADIVLDETTSPLEWLTAMAAFTGLVVILIKIARLPGYPELIDQWCRERQLQPVATERRYFWAGPFTWPTNGTAAFRITAVDQIGWEHHFWVRCGHWLLGMLKPEIRVQDAD